MAYVTVNGFDVEHASSLIVYENLIQGVVHINGQGCTDKYTPTDSIESVNFIDVTRILPYLPRFRRRGSMNNGAFHNEKNDGKANAPQSSHYTVPIDLFYDEGVPITDVQKYSSPIALREIVNMQIVQSISTSINVVTFAKQIEAFFRNGDNFNRAKNHDKGSIVPDDITDAELASAVYQFDPSASGATATSPTMQFITANASLSKGIPEIGAMFVPADKRQAFLTYDLHAKMMSQYAQNASEASARILATGFMNPFTQSPSVRINGQTGLLGTYNGVDLYALNDVTKMFVYVALGILGTIDDPAEDFVSCRAHLDAMHGMIVYGEATLRGIVGPYIEANPNTYWGGVYILPRLKMGVEVLSGRSIKVLVDGGANLATEWDKTAVALLMNTLTFTPIDGTDVTGNVVTGFNDGTTN